MTDINLKDIIHTLLIKWWIIFIFIILFGSAAYLRNEYLLVPVYEANTTLYVGKNSEKTGLATNDLALGTALLADYREIAKSRLVASKVIETLGLKNISSEGLAGRIDVSQKNSTRVIQISVRDSNPQRAMDIANTVADVFQQKVIEIIQVEIVQVIDKAEMPRYPISPDKGRNLMMALIIGIALSVGFIFLLDYLDATIKTPADVEAFIGLPVIGTIPFIQQRKKGAMV